MKKLLIKGLLLLAVLALCARLTASAQQNSVTGTFDTDKFNGKTLLLKIYDFEKNSFRTIDSLTVKEQKFYYDGIVQPAQALYLFQETNGKIAWGAQIIAGEGIAFMHTNGQGETIISGTPSNDKLQQFKTKQRPWEQKVFDVYAKSRELEVIGKMNSKLADSIDQAATGYIRKNRLATLHFVTDNIENPAGQSLVPEIMNLPNDILEGIIVGLAPAVQTAPAIQALTEKINAPRRLRYGQPAMDFRVENIDKQINTIQSVTPKGKVVLLDFWASWCVPCIKSMPHLKELQAKYKDKGFEIIGISIDSKEDAWRKKVAELNLPWAQYLDTFREGSNKYLVTAIPHTVLLAADGSIIATRLDSEDLDERLKKYLRTSK